MEPPTVSRNKLTQTSNDPAKQGKRYLTQVAHLSSENPSADTVKLPEKIQNKRERKQSLKQVSIEQQAQYRQP